MPDFPKTIGPQFLRYVMPWFENFWHKHERYPRSDEIMEKWGWTIQEVQILNYSLFWEKALERRGMSKCDTPELTVEQTAAISIITNFSDRRSVPVKLASIGVTTEQINGWYKDKAFKQELQLRADSVLENSHTEVQASLIKKIQAGDFPAIKFYYEITGRAQSPDAINVKQTLQRVMEAVQANVHDPATLRAIAQHIQGTSAQYIQEGEANEYAHNAIESA